MTGEIKILYQDQYFFAIHKPSGFFVHPPERSPYPVPMDRVCTHVLKDTLGQKVYPVHRLDAATSGVLLFTTSPLETRSLSQLFTERKLKKTYFAVARGWLDSAGLIDIPLECGVQKALFASTTHYLTRSQIELPYSVSKRYSTSRYSLLEVTPTTGRWHQIRRHLDRIAHPIIGDIDHGDSHHNRFFRDTLKIKGLCLLAASIELEHPWTRESVKIQSDLCEKWQRIFELFSQ